MAIHRGIRSPFTGLRTKKPVSIPSFSPPTAVRSISLWWTTFRTKARISSPRGERFASSSTRGFSAARAAKVTP